MIQNTVESVITQRKQMFYSYFKMSLPEVTAMINMKTQHEFQNVNHISVSVYYLMVKLTFSNT